jgi:hypothetical protein
MQQAIAEGKMLLEANLGGQEYIMRAQEIAMRTATLQQAVTIPDGKGGNTPVLGEDGQPLMNAYVDPVTYKQNLDMLMASRPDLTAGLPGQPAPASPAAPGGASQPGAETPAIDKAAQAVPGSTYDKATQAVIDQREDVGPDQFADLRERAPTILRAFYAAEGNPAKMEEMRRADPVRFGIEKDFYDAIRKSIRDELSQGVESFKDPNRGIRGFLGQLGATAGANLGVVGGLAGSAWAGEVTPGLEQSIRSASDPAGERRRRAQDDYMRRVASSVQEREQELFQKGQFRAR